VTTRAIVVWFATLTLVSGILLFCDPSDPTTDQPPPTQHRSQQ